MNEFQLERRGMSKTFHGWNMMKTVHIELDFHHPKNEFFLDIETCLERVVCETFCSLNMMVNYANRYLEGKGINERIVLTPEQITDLESNQE